MQIDVMLQSLDDSYNTVEIKQHIFLTKLNLEPKQRTKVFPNKTNLQLTSFGFKQAKELNLVFTQLMFPENLTVKEIKQLGKVCQCFYFVHSNCDCIYTTDETFIALYTVFNGNKKALF